MGSDVCLPYRLFIEEVEERATSASGIGARGSNDRRREIRSSSWDRCGWGTWIRTKTNRVRVCCATVTPFPNGLPSAINSLFGYPGKSHAARPGQIAARWSERSTRLVLPLASAEAEAFLRSALPGRTAPGMPKLRRRRRLPCEAWRDRRCPRIRDPVCAASAREMRSAHILRPMTDIASPQRHAAQLAGLSRACNACSTKQEGSERSRHSARQVCERARFKRGRTLWETIA